MHGSDRTNTVRHVGTGVLAIWLLMACGCGQRIVGFPLDRPSDGGLQDGDLDGGDALVVDAADAEPADGGDADIPDAGDGGPDDGGPGDGGPDDGGDDGATVPDAAAVDGGPLCGNGVLDANEECDPPGSTQGCTTSCNSSGTQTCLGDCSWDPVCNPPSETCNGFDDNCDGLVDEGLFGVQVPEVRVTTATGDSVEPALMWTGTQFSLVWGDDRSPAGVYFNGLSNAGSILYSDTFLSGLGTGVFSPDVDHIATGTVVVWEAGGEVYFTRVDQTGTLLIDPPVLITGTAGSYRPSVASVGPGEHGVAWTDARDGDFEIYFAILDDSGTKLTGGDIRVSDATGNSIHPSLVENGTEYGLAWMDARHGNFEIYFARMNSSGTKIGSDVRITDNPLLSASPTLVWNPAQSEYGLAWLDMLAGFQEVFFTRISDQGVKLAADIPVSNAFSFCWGARALTWSGQFYGLVWEDLRSGSFDVYFTRLTPDGTKLDNDIPVTTGNFNSQCPYVRWNGAEFGVAWTDDRHGGAGGDGEIYFSIVGCP